MSWIVTSNDIEKWTSTNKRSAEEKLPLLFKKILFSNSKNIKDIHIPSDDSISTSGIDGCFEYLDEHPIIPQGKIIVEFGTNKNIHKKANEDYNKRTNDKNIINKQEITFLFVTS